MEAPRLTLLPLLERWSPNTGTLSLNVAAIPVGDPRLPLAAASGARDAPAFVGAAVMLRPHVSNSPTRLPTFDFPPRELTLRLTMPASQTAIFSELATRFDVSEPQQAFERARTFQLRKYLPKSYRASFGFLAPKTDLAVIDDSYVCALRCPRGDLPDPTAQRNAVSWGEVFAMLMRQPRLARAAGLIHRVTLPLGGDFPGGWVFFSLADTSDFAVQALEDPNYVRIFGTRVPALETGRGRPVFTVVSFPIAREGAEPEARVDEVFDEAARFDDGFAKIVHARQPDTTELAFDDGQGLPLLRDPGIQLGWDDEDLLIGMNRGVADNPDGSFAANAPSAVAGYRVDVRAAGDAKWTSLCAVAGPPQSFAGVDLAATDQELSVEVHPSKVAEQFWLPAYFTRWAGGSLVARTDDDIALGGEAPRDAPLPYSPVGAEAVPLRYGRSYEFRVRLTDLAGAGPGAGDSPENAAVAPVARHDMRRRIRMRPVEFEAPGPDPAQPVSVRVRRPRIGYPEAVFTGHPRALETLRGVVAANATRPSDQVQSIVMPDPDATFLEVSVYVEQPAFDPIGDRDGFRLLSRTYRAFPVLDDPANEAPLDLQLNWVAVARLSDRNWTIERDPVAATGPVDLPAARNVKVELRAVGSMDLTYYSSESAAIGDMSPLWDGTLRIALPEEVALLHPLAPVDALSSVILQPEIVPNSPTRASPTQSRPSPLYIPRLAAALELVADNGALFAPPGRRAVFSCNGLTHTLAPDSSSLTLTAPGELTGVWINVLRLRIARDWSWIGLRTQGISVSREIKVSGEDGREIEQLAQISLEHAVNLQAGTGVPDRESIDVIIFDAFAPPLNSKRHPREVILSYEVALRSTALTAGAAEEVTTLTTRLPVATAPRNAPQLVSAGHALAPYLVAPDYAETGDRQKMLWLEIAEDPLKDPLDQLFFRIVAEAPDPMLLRDYEPDPSPASLAEIDLDPELVRVIRPDQPDDSAGLSALRPLVKALDSDRHYAVPLPPSLGPHSPELFGFFTLELRVGHPASTEDTSFWSTAQARYGPPKVIDGVQFPPPRLQLSVRREVDALQVSAPYAQPVRTGRRLPGPPPNTEIWFVLYARVLQADGATRRNVQLLTTRGQPFRRDPPGPSGVQSVAAWPFSEIEAALGVLGLPNDMPLSAVAIELLPEPNGAFVDPLGGDLGEVRVLRISRLNEVPQDCCSKL